MLTLAGLVEAYKSGEITEPMVVSGDLVRVDQPHDREWGDATPYYAAYTEELLKQLLDYVGIPHRHV